MFRQMLLTGIVVSAMPNMAIGQSLATQKHVGQPGSAPAPTAHSIDLSGLEIVPASLDFEAVAEGQNDTLQVTLRNTGYMPLTLDRVRFLLGASGNSSAFTVTIDGNEYAGGSGDVSRKLFPAEFLAPQDELVVDVRFEPTEEQYDSFTLSFETAWNGPIVSVPVVGLGGHFGDPYLHVVIDGPRYLIDYDGNGNEPVILDGTGSHTHEPGHTLAAYEWRVGGVPSGTGTTLGLVLTQPSSTIELQIWDDNVVPRSLVGGVTVDVVPPSEVPGVLTYYYDASGTGPQALLDSVPASADFIEQHDGFLIGGIGLVGGSPFASDVMVRSVGTIDIPQFGTYTFDATGGNGERILIDGMVVDSTPQLLTVGQHGIEVRIAVDTLADLPLNVVYEFESTVSQIESDLLTHDQTGVAPVIHAMTSTGDISGGDPITIEGFGFFPPSQVVVHWGGMDLIDQDFTSITPTEIQFPSPAGGGSIAVSVETNVGESNVKTFQYVLGGPPPIQFKRETIVSVTAPTGGVWAPDGKLYVCSLDGRITALEFDQDYDLVSQTVFDGVSALANDDAIGITVNPYDPPSPVKLYVSHGQHFLHGGDEPTSPSPYTGQVSVLTGPDFDTPVPLVTGLPVSNHDHAVNEIEFDNNGDLYIAVGSQTNAGVPHINHGNLPESPLSAAVLKAWTSRPGFNGAVTYVETDGGAPNDDQIHGNIVDVAPGVDVEVQAAGLRNPYGLVYTTRGFLYATDNGPNVSFGGASTGPTTEDPGPFDGDELNLVEWGNYYGSPNRNRGRTDPRQNVYYGGLSGPPSIADTLFQMSAWLPPSTDGIDEYRSAAFQSQIRGQLIVQEYQNKLRRVIMRPDGRFSNGQQLILPNTVALGVTTGPGGAIVSIDFEHHEVEILEADDLSSASLEVWDVFPWRAPATGGAPFVLSGRGFGTLANTMVTIGGKAATLTSVSWGRIKGTIPAETAPTTEMLDIVVTVGGNSDTLDDAFRYLLGPGLEPGRWQTLANVSSAMGEVAAGVIDGVMYLVGEGATATMAYDLQNRQWLAPKAQRTYNGHHHAAEVIDGKLYLIGGIGGGSEGRVQIYDPGTDSWSPGADMPWSGGSVSTSVIDGMLYAAGGILSTFTVANCAVYDPVADTWTARAAMPDGGRNHTATATDGEKMYVFGGRKGGNFVANGHDSVMIYDPVADTWTWNGAMGSTLVPLPEARGGMGKAIWLRGEFYVFGGETLDDPDANPNGVYDRVDVYDPAANTWRLEKPMITARHGIFPVLFQGHVFIAAGGTQSATSWSGIFETFTRQ